MMGKLHFNAVSCVFKVLIHHYPASAFTGDTNALHQHRMRTEGSPLSALLNCSGQVLVVGLECTKNGYISTISNGFQENTCGQQRRRPQTAATGLDHSTACSSCLMCFALNLNQLTSESVKYIDFRKYLEADYSACSYHLEPISSISGKYWKTFGYQTREFRFLLWMLQEPAV